MGGAQRAKLSPLAVAAQAKRLVKARILPRDPLWYQPVLDTPPMTDLSRKPAQTHQGRVGNKPVDIRAIQSINRGYEVYFRKRFYKEHPWELARPRVVVEEDGADYVRRDWSKMEQFAKPLDGESVVQRALYLMKERLSPVQRWQQVRGFDPSRARGRPLPNLPPQGNIEERILDPDVSRHHQLDLYHQYYSTQIDMLNLEIADLERARDILIGSPLRGRSPPALRLAVQQKRKQVASKISRARAMLTRAWRKQRAVIIKKTGDLGWIKSLEEILPHDLMVQNALVAGHWRQTLVQNLLVNIKELKTTFWSQRFIPAIADRRINIRRLIKKCQDLRRAQRAHFLISPQTAYLQACSEFYALRQQEEMDVRMAVIQANAFKRKMGPTTNEKEAVREGRVLAQWEREAQRLKKLVMDARRRRRSGELENVGEDRGGVRNDAEEDVTGTAGSKPVVY